MYGKYRFLTKKDTWRPTDLCFCCHHWYKNSNHGYECKGKVAAYWSENKLGKRIVRSKEDKFFMELKKA